MYDPEYFHTQHEYYTKADMIDKIMKALFPPDKLKSTRAKQTYRQRMRTRKKDLEVEYMLALKVLKLRKVTATRDDIMNTLNKILRKG